MRHLNQMKGGSQDESPYYHSFGKFVQHEDFVNFDVQSDDFPMNMEYSNIERVFSEHSEKLPHLRLVFKDE